MIDDTVVISSVLTDSPAERSGLKIFDKIIGINDTVIAGKSLSFDTIRKMLIPETEAPSHWIYCNGTPKKFTLIPDDIQISSVHPYLFDSLKTLLVKIDRFGSKTYQEFMLAILRRILKRIVKGKHLILDLRNNPGGYLPEATNILMSTI